MFLFIHIPKTAGTSFRHGLYRIFDHKEILLDYGPKASQTDTEILELYKEDIFSPQKVVEIAKRRNIQVLCGHFHVDKYLLSFPKARLISFVREPLQRCYSEYLHFQRHNNYSGSFFQFFSGRKNLQSNFLNNWPEHGFLGISEKYAICLQTLATKTGLNVPLFKKNTHRDNLNFTYSHSVIGEESVKVFYDTNKNDINLYSQIFNQWKNNSSMIYKNIQKGIKYIKKTI